MKTPVMKKAFAAIWACFALAGCSGVDVLNFVSPKEASLTRDIAYGDLPRQKLNVLVPEGLAPGETRPVVVFFYGGSWKSGARGDYRFAGEALTRLGYVAVVPDYRLYPEVKYPAFQEDAARALRWTQDHIAQFHGRSDAIFVMGHSAGAHVGALLTLDARYAQAAGVRANTVKGFIGLAGPYAFTPSKADDVRDVFAGVADEETTKPINYVTAAAPPMLLLYGLDDGTVERPNAQILAERMRAAGRDVTLREYEGVGHVGIVLALTPLFDGKASVLADIRGFVDRLAGRKR
jgi:acetyl esterase/lipase